MALTLTIENETTLTSGGALSYTVKGQRGFDIGRDHHLDWTLPDPSRFISGKHCEVRYQDNHYWLYDVSTNGTFLNGGDGRMREPHRLSNGDRIAIGHYLILVTLDRDSIAAPGAAGGAHISVGGAPAGLDDLWGGFHPPASPVAATPRPAPPRFAPSAGADFLDWAADAPAPPPPPAFAPAEPNPAAGAIKGRRSVWLDDDAAEPAPNQIFSPGDDSASPPQAPVAVVPTRAAQRAETVAASPPAAADGLAFVRAFAQGSGLPEAALQHHDPIALAQLLGGLMRLTVEDLKQLLAARFEAKRLVKSGSQTQIQMLDNNPLKFTPSAEDALKIMFGPPTRGYLDAPRALKQSFADIKAHQVDTYAAMQAAVRELTDDFDPQQIDAALGREGGLSALVGSRKAKAWEVFVARWRAKTLRQDNGMLGAFMAYFSKHYDRDGGQ